MKTPEQHLMERDPNTELNLSLFGVSAWDHQIGFPAVSEGEPRWCSHRLCFGCALELMDTFSVNTEPPVARCRWPAGWPTLGGGAEGEGEPIAWAARLAALALCSNLVAEHESENGFACGKTLSHVSDRLESKNYCCCIFVCFFKPVRKVPSNQEGNLLMRKVNSPVNIFPISLRGLK